MKFLSKQVLLKFYLLLGAFESAVVFYQLLSIPADLKNILILGYSFQRLLLLGVVLILFFLFGLFFSWISFSENFLNKSAIFVENVLNDRWRYFFLYSFSSALAFTGFVVLLLPFEELTGYAAFVERLAPIIYLGGGIGVQTLLGQFLWRGKKLNWHAFYEWKRIYIFTGIVLGFLLVFSIWVARTGVGLFPELHGWHSPGTPITFYQLFLAWLVVLPFIVWGDSLEKWLENFQRKQSFNIRLDMILSLLLWLGAILVWWGEPVRKDSYFTPSPTPPNFEYYPHSDAAIYDLSAQNLLIGADQNNKIMLRPLYVFFLTFLHVIGGQQYENVIYFQIVFLAVIPALVYFLGSMFGGRPVGLLTAILIILREKNSIALTNVIEVSHSKLLLSDLPMMALMILMVYFLIKWLKRSPEDIYLGVSAGASFGMVMLVRSSQAQLIIPVLFLGIIFTGGFQFKRAFKRILVFIIGFAIVAAPWIWRNYEVNGKPVIESTEFYIRVFAGAYTEPTDTVDILPGEAPQDYSNRIKRQIFKYILDHPAKLARDYSSYFIRNEIDSVIYLPMSLKLDNLRSYISRTLFWSDPLIHLTYGSGLIFFVTLWLIVLGVSLAVQRLGFLGLLPLLIHITYNFSLSLARISGWRFILPVDWIMQLYYCIGLVALTFMAISLILNKLLPVSHDDKDEEKTADNLFAGVKKQQLLLAFFIFIGISLPLIERFVPERYPEIGTDKMISQHSADGILLDHGDRITALDLKSFLESKPAAVVLYGRALYPIFYKQGEFWGDDNPFSLLVRNFDRLQFTYIGSENALVFIQLDQPPQYFPNASDVFILGCREDAGIRALAIKVNDEASFIKSSHWQGLTCSMQ